jgi:hypothetical protein
MHTELAQNVPKPAKDRLHSKATEGSKKEDK